MKIFQNNRLDANSFVSVKLWKQTKENCTDLSRDPIRILGTEDSLGTDWHRKAQEFYVLYGAMIIYGCSSSSRRADDAMWMRWQSSIVHRSSVSVSSFNAPLISDF